jgi:hypothetical protein
MIHFKRVTSDIEIIEKKLCASHFSALKKMERSTENIVEDAM